MKKFFCIIGVILLFLNSYTQETIKVDQGEDYIPFVINVDEEALAYVQVVDHCKIVNAFVNNKEQVNDVVKNDELPVFYFLNELVITDKGLFVFNKEEKDLWQIFFVRQGDVALDSIAVSVIKDSVENSVIEITSFYEQRPFTKIKVNQGKVAIYSFKERKNTFKKINPYLFLPRKRILF